MAIEQLRTDYKALAEDIGLLTGATALPHDEYRDSPQLMWADMREWMTIPEGAELEAIPEDAGLQTKFGVALVRMLEAGPNAYLPGKNNAANVNACAQAEPGFLRSLRPTPSLDYGLSSPVLLAAENGDIEGVMKFDGERSILGLVDGVLLEGGLYGLPHTTSMSIKYAAKDTGGLAIVPTAELVARAGDFMRIRMTNFALDESVRENLGSLINKTIFGTYELSIAANELAAQERQAAIKRGQQVLRQL